MVRSIADASEQVSAPSKTETTRPYVDAANVNRGNTIGRCSISRVPMKRVFASGALVALVTACGAPETNDVPPTETPAADSISWPQEEWERSTLEAEGIDPAPINQFIDELEAETYGLVDHFVLVRHGRIVAERRFERDYAALTRQFAPEELLTPNAREPMYDYDDADWHPYYRGTDLHSVQSVTKSVMSAAVGIAIDEGQIEGTNAPVLPFVADYSFDRSDSRKAQMTLDDLLTMRSGILWVTEGGYGDETHSTDVMEDSANWIQMILDQRMDQVPGTVWEYNDGNSMLAGKILHAATGKRPDEWAREKLFVPIGIDEYYWKITPAGEADTEGGLYLTAHDMARIGYLFLRNGLWDGQRVISEDWVRRSQTPLANIAPDDPDNTYGYGYQWWVPEHENGRAVVFKAIGYGGQHIMVFPDQDIVAVFQGWDLRGDYDAASETLRTSVLPAALASR